MLKKPVKCEFGKDELKICFPKIQVYENDQNVVTDNSMQAVLRSVYPRIERTLPESTEPAKFTFRCYRENFGSGFETLNFTSKTREITRLRAIRNKTPGLGFVFVMGASAASVIKTAKDLAETRNAVIENFHYDEFLSLYVDKTGRSAIFVNEKLQKTICMFCCSNSLDSVRMMHQSASALVRLLPWLFKDEPATKDEIDLMKSLTYDTEEQFLSIMDKKYSNPEIRKMMITAMTSDFTSEWYKEQVKALEHKIIDAEKKIDQKYEEIRALRRAKEHDNIFLSATRSKVNHGETGDSEFVEYLIANKEVTLLNKEDDKISFAITAPMENYDLDKFESLIALSDSSDLIYAHSPYSYEESKALLNAIWGKDKEYTLMNYAIYSINKQAVVDVYRTNRNESPSFSNCIPNPHIVHLNCLGDYRDMLSKAEETLDFVGALMVCAQSARSINMSESITVEKLMLDLWQTTEAVLRDAQGNPCTVKQAVEKLKERGIQ